MPPGLFERLQYEIMKLVGDGSMNGIRIDSQRITHGFCNALVVAAEG